MFIQKAEPYRPCDIAHNMPIDKLLSETAHPKDDGVPAQKKIKLDLACSDFDSDSDSSSSSRADVSLALL